MGVSVRVFSGDTGMQGSGQVDKIYPQSEWAPSNLPGPENKQGEKRTFLSPVVDTPPETWLGH